MNKKFSARSIALAVEVAVAVAVALASASAFAENADRTKEMVVQAVTGEFDHGAGVYVITKDVTITQGTLKVTGNKGTVTRRANGTYMSSLDGGPVCFRQRTEKGDWAQGIADRAEHDNATGIVELIGNAKLYVGDNEERANYILYNTQTSKAEARESKDRKTEGRGVTFILPPAEAEPPVAPVAAGAAGSAVADAVGKPPAKAAKAPVVKTPNPPKRNEPAFSRCA
jgi:lipopolysaccharide export system protein LptA